MAIEDESTFNEIGYERYFQELHGRPKRERKGINTRLDSVFLDGERVEQLLCKASIKNASQNTEQSKQHEKQFLQWRVELQSGFNILCYGIGCKRSIMRMLASTLLVDAPCVVFDGWNAPRGVHSIKTLLCQIGLAMGVLQHDIDVMAGKFATDMRIAVEILAKYITRPDSAGLLRKTLRSRLYLIIHGIDSPTFIEYIELLCLLAHLTPIRIIATAEHVRASTMFDSAVLNWVYHEVTTPTRPAYSELEAEPDSLFKNILTSTIDNARGSQGIMHVLASLNDKARAVFRILANHQLSHKGGAFDDIPAGAMTYQALFKAARAAFHVSHEAQFKTLLGEFRDHAVVYSGRRSGSSGQEYMWIGRVNEDELRGILDGLVD